jgi:hypothetical protein
MDACDIYRQIFSTTFGENTRLRRLLSVLVTKSEKWMPAPSIINLFLRLLLKNYLTLLCTQIRNKRSLFSTHVESERVMLETCINYRSFIERNLKIIGLHRDAFVCRFNTEKKWRHRDVSFCMCNLKIIAPCSPCISKVNAPFSSRLLKIIASYWESILKIISLSANVT